MVQVQFIDFKQPFTTMRLPLGKDQTLVLSYSNPLICKMDGKCSSHMDQATIQTEIEDRKKPKQI